MRSLPISPPEILPHSGPVAPLAVLLTFSGWVPSSSFDHLRSPTFSWVHSGAIPSFPTVCLFPVAGVDAVPPQ
jgi:hypothetical protein